MFVLPICTKTSKLGKENLSVVKEWTKTSVIKAVYSEAAIPVSPEKIVPETEISSPFHIHSDPSRNVHGTTAELVSNTQNM